MVNQQHWQKACGPRLGQKKIELMSALSADDDIKGVLVGTTASFCVKDSCCSCIKCLLFLDQLLQCESCRAAGFVLLLVCVQLISACSAALLQAQLQINYPY